MLKCDFNDVAKHSSTWVFCKFAAYIQNIFLQEHFWRDASAKSSEMLIAAKTR